MCMYVNMYIQDQYVWSVYVPGAVLCLSRGQFSKLGYTKDYWRLDGHGNSHQPPEKKCGLLQSL